MKYSLFFFLGIIIDTFADMRATGKEITEDNNNRCFICSLPRETFERQNINFHEHIKRDHNMWQVLLLFLIMI